MIKQLSNYIRMHYLKRWKILENTSDLVSECCQEVTNLSSEQLINGLGLVWDGELHGGDHGGPHEGRGWGQGRLQLGEESLRGHETEFAQTLGHHVPGSLLRTLRVSVQLIPDTSNIVRQHLQQQSLLLSDQIVFQFPFFFMEPKIGYFWLKTRLKLDNIFPQRGNGVILFLTRISNFSGANIVHKLNLDKMCKKFWPFIPQEVRLVIQ